MKPWAIVVENRKDGLITRHVEATFRTERGARRYWDSAAWSRRRSAWANGSNSGGERLIDLRSQTFVPVEHYDPTVEHWTCPHCGGEGSRDHFGACERHRIGCPGSPGNRG